MYNQTTQKSLFSYARIIKNELIPFINSIKVEARDNLKQLYISNQANLQKFYWGINHDTWNFGTKNKTTTCDHKINENFPLFDTPSASVLEPIIWAFFLFQFYNSVNDPTIKTLLNEEIIKTLKKVMKILKESSKGGEEVKYLKEATAMLLSVELVTVSIEEYAEQQHTAGINETHTVPAVYKRTNNPIPAGCLLDWVTINNEIFTDFVSVLTQLTSAHITQEMLFIALAGDQTRKKIGWIECEASTLPQAPVKQLALFMQMTSENKHNPHLKHHWKYSTFGFWEKFIAPLTNNAKIYEALTSALISPYCNNGTNDPEQHLLLQFLKGSVPFYNIAADYFLLITSNKIQFATITNLDVHNRLSCLVHATTITNTTMQTLLIDTELGKSKENKEAIVDYILSTQNPSKKLQLIDDALGNGTNKKKSFIFQFLKTARIWGSATEWTKGSSLEKLAIARRDLTGKAVVQEIRTVNDAFDSYDCPDAREIDETLAFFIKDTANDDAISNIKWCIGQKNKPTLRASRRIPIPLSGFLKRKITQNTQEDHIASDINNDTTNNTIHSAFINTFSLLYHYQIEVLQEKYQQGLSTTAAVSPSITEETNLQKLRREMIEHMIAFLTILNNYVQTNRANCTYDKNYILIILNMELINDDPEDGISYLPASSLISWVTADETLYQAFIALVTTLGEKNRSWEMFVNALEGRQERNTLEKDETDSAQQAISETEQNELTTRIETLYPLMAETSLGEIAITVLETDDGPMIKHSRKLNHADTLRNPAANVDDLYKKIQCLPLEERFAFLHHLLFEQKKATYSKDSLLHFLEINHDEHYVRHFAAEYLITQKLLDQTTSTLKLTEDKTQGISSEMLALINNQAGMGPEQLTEKQRTKMASWWNTYKKELRRTIKAIPNLTDRIIFQRRMLTQGTPLYTFLKHQRTWFPDLGLTSQFSIAQKDEANTRKLLAILFLVQYEKLLKEEVKTELLSEAIRLIQKGDAKENFKDHIFALEKEEKEDYIAEIVQVNTVLNDIFTTQRGLLPVTTATGIGGRGVYGKIDQVARRLGVGIYTQKIAGDVPLKEIENAAASNNSTNSLEW